MKAGSTRGHPRRAAVVASLVSVHAHVLTSHLLQHGQELRFLRCVIKPRSALNAEGDPRRCLNTTGLDHQLISTVEVSPIFEEPADGFVEGIHAIHLWVSKDRTNLVTRCHLLSPSRAQANGPAFAEVNVPAFILDVLITSQKVVAGFEV